MLNQPIKLPEMLIHSLSNDVPGRRLRGEPIEQGQEIVWPGCQEKVEECGLNCLNTIEVGSTVHWVTLHRELAQCLDDDAA